MASSTAAPHGRPRVTSHAAIESASFELFERRGFETTTMDDIASRVGIGRRTLFRYYPSKNDILWGRFDDSLHDFEESLRRTEDDRHLARAIEDAVVEFNSYDDAALPQHRRRMRLLLRTPALLGHSELRYRAWRGVVARFVAKRSGEPATALRPVIAGRLALALSLSAYELWLDRPDQRIDALLRQAFAEAERLFGD